MKKLSIIALICMCFVVSLVGCTKKATNVTNDDYGQTTVATEKPTEKVTEKPTEKETEPIHSHSYSAATCTEAGKCSCGETNGTALGHSYSTATCTKAATCTRCGATDGSAKGHSFQAATCTTPQKCTQCGVTEGAAAGHSYQAATCSKPETCTKCGATNGGVASHNYGSTGECSMCGSKITAKDLQGTITCTLIIPRNGTNNFYADVEIRNQSGAKMKISPYINFNGFICNTFQDFYYLDTGYKVTLSAFRAINVRDRFENKYCDMYLDNNSKCHFVATIYEQVFVIYCDVNGNTTIEKQ